MPLTVSFWALYTSRALNERTLKSFDIGIANEQNKKITGICARLVFTNTSQVSKRKLINK
jgi:predicted transcriptional regulator YheO